MLGLIVFGTMALYLVLSITVVVWAIRRARRLGQRPWAWGAGAAFVMYLIPFWDWIPTVVMHRYYCEKEAGFWVYKTPEQWMKENPGVMEGLVANKGESSRHEQFDDGHGNTNVYLVNERFSWIVTRQDMPVVFPIIRTERQIKDNKKNEVLARYIDFASGNSVRNTIGPPGPLKFWLNSRHCSGGEENAIGSAKFFKYFGGAEK